MRGLQVDTKLTHPLETIAAFGTLKLDMPLTLSQVWCQVASATFVILFSDPVGTEGLQGMLGVCLKSAKWWLSCSILILGIV